MGFWSTAVLVVVTAFVVNKLPNLIELKLPPAGQGYAAPGWRKVADVFRKSLETGSELGGAIAVYYRGKLVVEFSGGYADAGARQPWNKDTLSMYASATKGVGAVVMAMLVDRGLLDYDKPVASYWPEFAQNGKQDITVRQLISHQAGLAHIEEKFSAKLIATNPGKMGQILAGQKPNWKPGSAHGYHGITHGLYLDQIVRRVDPQHRDLSQFFAEEIAQPFGIDYFIGLPKEENYRCSRQVGLNLFSLQTLLARRYWRIVWKFFFDAQSLPVKAILNPPEYMQDGLENNPEFRSLPTASSHGYGTAISMAKFYGLLTDLDNVDKQRILSVHLVNQLSEPETSGMDLCLLMNLTYGLGTLVRRAPHGAFMFGAPGAGGQMAYGDAKYQLGWSYVTNYQSIYAMGDDPRYLAVEKAIYECAEEEEKKTRT